MIFRKEARRRELKKNKKQRILVRTAVLKGKRPQEVIEELSKVLFILGLEVLIHFIIYKQYS